MGISKSRMRMYYNEYKSVGCRTLDDVYGRYSSAKAHAYEYIRERMHEQGGTGLSVINGNTFSFTTGYTYVDEHGREHFVVDTRDNVQDVLVSDVY